MAYATVARPAIGHPQFSAFPQDLDAAIAAIRDQRDREIAKLEEAKSIVGSLASTDAIPQNITQEIKAVLCPFFDNETGEFRYRAMGRLEDLALFAEGYLVLNAADEFVTADDYAAELLETRIAAIDWTREPGDKEERDLRRHVLDHVREESSSPINEANNLNDLCSGTPASDLAKAIKDAEVRWSAECSKSHNEAMAKRRRTMAFRLREKVGVANLIGAMA